VNEPGATERGPHAAARSREGLGNFAELPDLFAWEPNSEARGTAPFAHSPTPLRKVPDNDAMARANERRDRGNEQRGRPPFEMVRVPFAHSSAPFRRVTAPFAHSSAPFRRVAAPFAHSPANEAHSPDLDARSADNAARSPRNLHRDRVPVRLGSMPWRRKRASDAHSRAPLERARRRSRRGPDHGCSECERIASGAGPSRRALVTVLKVPSRMGSPPAWGARGEPAAPLERDYRPGPSSQRCAAVLHRATRRSRTMIIAQTGCASVQTNDAA
jgi:hypothetical protein